MKGQRDLKLWMFEGGLVAAALVALLLARTCS
jgi:hypothetical protein